MRRVAVLIDFGASRIKSASLDLDTWSKLEIKSTPSVDPVVIANGRYEVAPDRLREAMLSHIRSHAASDREIESIYLCSEMHGFIAADDSANPLSNYISWKDQRGKTNVELLNHRFGSSFLEATGMKPKAGLPITNLPAWAREHNRRGVVRVLSIPEWLAFAGKPIAEPLAHETMLAASGLYNLEQRSEDPQILDWLLGSCGIEAKLARTAVDVEAVSEIEIPGQATKARIYTGVGDHQCALYGAGVGALSRLSVNIGTGSQVSIVSGHREDNIESRPYLGGKRLNTITHIPAGRVLNVFVRYFANQFSFGAENKVWAELNELSLNSVESSSLKFDLAIFDGAWGYSSGGSIAGITESNLNSREMMASLIRSFCEQYIKALSLVDPNKEHKTVLLSGGIPQRMEIIKSFIAKRTGLEVLVSNETEETLEGLARIAKQVEPQCAGALRE